MKNFWQTLPKPFTALAPMDDVTDTVFRDIVCLTARPHVFFTEFVACDALCSPGKRDQEKRLVYTKKQRPIVAQIWGADPHHIEEGARYVEHLGFDGVDINMGCPDKTVMSCGGGSALIGKYELVKEIIEAARRGAPHLPLSVKTRIGVKTIQTEDWIHFLLNQNLDALTIHGRTTAELSLVPTHWDEIGKVVQMKNTISPTTMIIGNGDVKNYKEACEKHKTCGVDGIMIGRGIFHDLWAFDTSPTPHIPTRQKLLQLLLKHTQLFCTTWDTTAYTHSQWQAIKHPERTKKGVQNNQTPVNTPTKPHKNFATLKKFFKIYVSGFTGAAQLRESLMETQNLDEVEEIIKHVFEHKDIQNSDAQKKFS